MLVFNYVESFQLPWSFSFLSPPLCVSRRPRGSAPAVVGGRCPPRSLPRPPWCGCPPGSAARSKPECPGGAARGRPGGPRKGAGLCLGRDERGRAQGHQVHQERHPSGTTDPGGHGSARRVATRRCPEPTGEGSRRAQHGAESPGHSSRRSSLGPPSLLLPCVTEWHLLLRPNHLAAKVASQTSVSCYAQHNRFLARSPFPSWAAQRSWSSFPARQQHQLQLLISSGCNPGWS